MVPFYTLFIYFIAINLFPIFLLGVRYFDYLFCNDCSKVGNSTTYDYIIVGSGSAGSLIAKRLAEDETDTILVLEAGSHTSSLLTAPSMGPLLQSTIFDWGHSSVSQQDSCLGLNNHASKWPSGKVFGGTSLMNNMIYLRGHQEDYKEWFQDTQFDYERDVWPYIKKLEDDLPVGKVPFSSDLQEVVLKTAEDMNFTIIDKNVDSDLGFSVPMVHIKDGQRFTSCHNLLEHKSSNMFVHTQAFVEKVLFKSDFEAYAVKYWYNGEVKYAKARKGVILSAGVVNTPKILLLSGVGPKEELETLKIPTKIDSPFVGQNLQDHLTTGLDLVVLNRTIGLDLSALMSPISAFRYYWNKSGPWTTVGCENIAFLKTNLRKNDPRPDLQFMFLNAGLSQDNGIHLRRLFGLSDRSFEGYFRKLWELTTVSVLPVLLHPKSRGRVKLASRNPFDKPVIETNYLNDSYDVQVLVHGLKFLELFFKSEVMEQFGAKMNDLLFPGCEQFEFKSDKYWECYVRHLTISSFHPVGTCKMGSGDDSVVDFNFQLRGANKLYVVDGSVVPSLSTGNINGPIMVLAEMAADQIKYKYYLSTKRCKCIELFINLKMCYK